MPAEPPFPAAPAVPDEPAPPAKPAAPPPASTLSAFPPPSSQPAIAVSTINPWHKTSARSRHTRVHGRLLQIAPSTPGRHSFGAPPSKRGKQEIKPFVVDRPFLFVVYDDEENAVMFLGRVEDPSRSDSGPVHPMGTSTQPGDPTSRP